MKVIFEGENYTPKFDFGDKVVVSEVKGLIENDLIREEDLRLYEFTISGIQPVVTKLGVVFNYLADENINYHREDSIELIS